jgi:hypothetical protein
VREPAALTVLQQQHAMSQRQLQLQSGSTIGTQTLPPPEPAAPVATAPPASGAPSPIPGLPPLAGPAPSGVTYPQGGANVPVPVGAVGGIAGAPLTSHMSTGPSSAVGALPVPIGPSHPSYTY